MSGEISLTMSNLFKEASQSGDATTFNHLLVAGQALLDADLTPAEAARVHYVIYAAHRRLGHDTESVLLPALERTYEQARQAEGDDLDLQGVIASLLSQTYLKLGQLEKAIAVSTQAGMRTHREALQQLRD